MSQSRQGKGKATRRQPRPSAAPRSAAARPGRRSTPQLRRWWWLLGLLPIIAIAVWWLGSSRGAAAPAGAIGGVVCRGFPNFAGTMGFTPQAALDTGDTRQPGLTLIDRSIPAPEPLTYQHPSWAQAGFLGPTMLDDRGNIYVAPVPQTSLYLNPLGEQNRVYRIDSNSADMALFAELPSAAPATETNPFGVLGLAADCDTRSLYVSSVAGSDRTHEVGRIYRLDLASGHILDQFEGVDAFGVAVHNGVHGKRLYFGLARSGEVRSVGLDVGGNFQDDVREAFSVADQSIDGNGRVRRISWTPRGEMVLTITSFSFTLVPPTTRQQLVYRYDPAADTWQSINSAP